MSSMLIFVATITLFVVSIACQCQCPQHAAIHPASTLDAVLDVLYATSEFKEQLAKQLADAVRIPTVTYDDMLPVGVDPRWDIFARLHEHLNEAFPRVFEQLEVTRVNTYGIVLHWQGSSDKKPVLITAHQDVVPVDATTVDKWIHPPFSGYYDGNWVWGRGTVDDKADLVEQFATIDALISQKFQPTRTFVFAYGFDEESAGTEGAGHLAEYLEEKYGRRGKAEGGFAMIVDEGGGYTTDDNVIFANPEVSEKGYLDVEMEVITPGGHSSLPPPHTGIGYLSHLLTALDSNLPLAHLPRSSTPFTTLQCFASYSPSFPPSLSRLVHEASRNGSDASLRELQDALSRDGKWAPVIKTTQAIDIIEGGVKVNALPERASAIINYRIAEHSSVAELQAHIASVLNPIARQYGLELNAFAAPSGYITLSDAFATALEPSPITPHTGTAWELIAGTIRATLETRSGPGTSKKEERVVVVPTLALGNTDTKSYWSLTPHIFRYSHRDEQDVWGDIHTVNEAIRADSLVQGVRWFTKLILNCDESELL